MQLVTPRILRSLLALICAGILFANFAHASSQTVAVGQSVKFAVSVQGSAPFTYQWRKNGTAISGATSASYTINSVTTADAATYTVVVANTVASSTSDNAVLTVTAAAVAAPVITSQPSSRTVTAGQSASFSVAASGTSLTYQWRKNGTAISGATGATYTIATTTTADSGSSYTVVVANTGGSATSNAAVLTVNAAAVAAPVITSQPSSRTVTAGQSASFSVTASGTSLTYQWRKNGTAISGATGATYTIATTTTADSGSSYTVVVANTVGSATSNAAVLTVNAASSLVQLTPVSYSARGQNGTTEGIAQLFDGQTSTKWLDFTSTSWVQIVVSAPTVLQAYSLTSANDHAERDPASWTLSGSNDGTTWTVIEKRTAQSWSSRFLTRDFVTPSSSTTYTRFRFDFQATSGSITQLAELELFGVTGKSPSTTTDFVPSSYSARGQNGTTEGIAKLFDGQAATKWLDFSGTTWVQINLASAKSLQVYSLTSANDHAERDPASWTLSGSNDGVTWTVIEKRTAQSWSDRFLTRDFVLATPSAAYSRFRFDFQATSGAITQLAELELSGTP